MANFVLDKRENIVGKEENAGDNITKVIQMAKLFWTTEKTLLEKKKMLVNIVCQTPVVQPVLNGITNMGSVIRSLTRQISFRGLMMVIAT